MSSDEIFKAELLIKSPFSQCYSYDLDLDQKLANETTVLVESYTVCQPMG